MDKFRGLDVDEGWIRRRFTELDTQLQELAAARRLVVASASAQADETITLTTDFNTPYAARNITAPAGYTTALVQLAVNAGTTFDTGMLSPAGNIGVAPRITVPTPAGPVTTLGSAISQGKNGAGAVSVSSTFNARVAIPQGTLTVSTLAYANGTARVAGSDNVHLSALVLFTRG